MDARQKLFIVGLGNIGAKYQNTRHNIGFMLVDYLYHYFGFNAFKAVKNSLITNHLIENTMLFLVKPQTYMNCSGSAVLEIKNFYKIHNDDIVVVHDDVDLSLGKLRYKINSSCGGQKGIRDINNSIGKDFHRIKIGIDRPQFGDLATYVLQKFTPQELQHLQYVFEFLAVNISAIYNKQWQFIHKNN